MCGRFTQQRPTTELAEIFGAEDLADDPGSHFNVAPTDEASVVVERDGRRAVTRYRWGLLPHWVEDGRTAAKRINARAETLERSPAFREAFRRRRCLVPVDSFYEWRREGGIRQPYRIAGGDGRPLVLAGLWAGRRDPETEHVVRTFTIVTTRANTRIAELHDRMPVVLGEDAWNRWLGREPAAAGELRAMLEPTEIDLEIYPVVRLVNDVRNDGPELIARLAG
ncbi:MAG TPA: SOS response-associated peptidase [Candidatus Limnocylindrales bacterium]|jgi:putative SOS response-associated peptidase YedK